MSFTKIQAIPTPEEFIARIPMSDELSKIKAQRDSELKDIIEGKDKRFVLIVGPCSASDETAVLDYTYRLAKLNDKVKDKLFIIPRIYTNKPRTNGDGYKGMLHQPDPTKGTNILAGIEKLREMHIKSISETHLTAADEMLYPENYAFLYDILSYVAIGARSVENQQHRLVSSGIDVPVGMKNPTSGDFNVMLNSIYAAQSERTFLYRDAEVSTHGNPLTHAIIRGYVNKHGQSLPNYHYEDLELLADMYYKKGVMNPFVVVDVNHANSGKKYYEQPRIVKEVLHSRTMNPTINDLVRGVMIESFIEEGNQKTDGTVYGKSITDACLGWNDTEKLILETADRV